MGKFKTLDLSVTKAGPLNSVGRRRYIVNGHTNQLDTIVDGNWRSRPKGRRLFSAEQIRVIRNNAANGFSNKELAETFGCSHVSIYHIVNRSIYRDVN